MLVAHLIFELCTDVQDVFAGILQVVDLERVQAMAARM